MHDRTRGYARGIDIAAPARVVWEALTTAERLREWCSPQAGIDPRPGGLVRASVDRVTQLEARIDVFEPGRRLRLIYLPSPDLPPGETALVDDFLLDEARPGMTLLRLLGSGIPRAPEWDVQYMRLRTGWGFALARLKGHIEGTGDAT